MPNNLRDKLRILLEDIKSLSPGDALARTEQFFLIEMNYLDTLQYMGNSDLLQIKGLATQHMIQFNPHEMETVGQYYIDQDLVRALCYVKATNQYFRSKGWMPVRIDYDKNKR